MTDRPDPRQLDLVTDAMVDAAAKELYEQWVSRDDETRMFALMWDSLGSRKSGWLQDARIALEAAAKNLERTTMTDHLVEARADLDRLEACNHGSWLASAVAHILDHLEAQQPDEAHGDAPDPLDEDNHADRYDRHGDRWAWCDTCGGFRTGGNHGTHKSIYGWSAAGLDEVCGPLTFAHQPAEPPEPDPLDEDNHTDRYDRHGKRWVWCDTCNGFRLDGHAVHKSNYGWSTVAELDVCYGPLAFAPR